MMNAEDIAEILKNLSETTKTESLGYLPQMFFAKWCLDNRTLPDVAKCLEENAFLSRSERIRSRGEYSLETTAHYLLNVRPKLFTEDDEDEYTAHDNWKLDESVKKQTETTLLSLNLSESAVPRKEAARGFDLYLRHILSETDAYRVGCSATSKAAERIARGLAAMVENVKTVYDPCCKLGDLLSCIKAGEKTGADEEEVYTSIAYIRAFLSGKPGTKICFGHHIEEPLTDEHGKIKTYDMVVSDISGIYSKKETALFQTDIHKRFQKYCPDLTTYSAAAAFCHAAASADGRKHIILIGDTGGFFRDGIFGQFSPEGVASILADDVLEAIIDIDVAPENKPAADDDFPSARFRCGPENETKRIYLFNGVKPDERRGKILFVNAAGCSASETVERVLSCVEKFEEVRGFSAIVPAGDLLSAGGKRRTFRGNALFTPRQHTACIAKPKETEISHILRDIKRLEEQRVSLMKNIEEIAASLAEEK